MPRQEVGRNARGLDRDTKRFTHAARIAAHDTLGALTRALASRYKHLNETNTSYPGANLTLRRTVTPDPHPTLA